MLVDRRVVMVERGKMDEVLALLQAEQARIRQVYNVGALRNYVPMVGYFDQLVLEAEWDSLADWNNFGPNGRFHRKVKLFWKNGFPWLHQVSLNCGRCLSRVML